MAGLAAAGAPEGSWLTAERQTGGRGRHGRSWVSPPGNLYASTLVRLRPTDPPPASLTLVAAVALHDTVALLLDGRPPALRLKWPNDLLLDEAKLSGILLERAADAVVIGFGVNCAHHPPDLDRPATSLAAHGVLVAPVAMREMLADSLTRWTARWRGEGVGAIRHAWLARAQPSGTALSVTLPDGMRVEGLFDGLDPDGALVLRLASGERRAIHAGDAAALPA